MGSSWGSSMVRSAILKRTIPSPAPSSLTSLLKSLTMTTISLKTIASGLSWAFSMRCYAPERRTREVGGSRQDTTPMVETREKKEQAMKQQRQCNLEKLTKAVTHIRLIEVNPGKLAALDAL